MNLIVTPDLFRGPPSNPSVLRRLGGCRNKSGMTESQNEKGGPKTALLKSRKYVLLCC